MSRVEELGHFMRCPTLKGADPDMCRCAEEDAYTGRGAPSGTAERRPDADARPPWKRQQVAMSKLWSAAGVTRRGDRLELLGVLLDRSTPETSNELTVGQADDVLAQLRGLERAGRLREWASEALAGRAAG